MNHFKQLIDTGVVAFRELDFLNLDGWARSVASALISAGIQCEVAVNPLTDEIIEYHGVVCLQLAHSAQSPESMRAIRFADINGHKQSVVWWSARHAAVIDNRDVRIARPDYSTL